jgi:RNA polymerase-binding transcription factor DksA
MPNIDATDIIVRPRADRTAEEILEAALWRTDVEQMNCEVCGKEIPLERIIAAQSRGQLARYDTDRCRMTAAKRRQRNGTQGP